MPDRVSHTVRFTFASLVATALLFAGLEAAASKYKKIGIESCGWEGNPCALAPLVVKAPAAVVGPVARS